MLRFPRIARLLRRRLLPVARLPDLVIGDVADPYMLRWSLLPRNPLINVYLHRVLKSDIEDALHDHPWASISLMLRGSVTEVFDTGDVSGSRAIGEGNLVYRPARFAHRLILGDGEAEAWTLFLTGPRVREWGFHCPQGWRTWKEFTAARADGGARRGCE